MVSDETRPEFDRMTVFGLCGSFRCCCWLWPLSSRAAPITQAPTFHSRRLIPGRSNYNRFEISARPSTRTPPRKISRRRRCARRWTSIRQYSARDQLNYGLAPVLRAGLTEDFWPPGRCFPARCGGHRCGIGRRPPRRQHGLLGFHQQRIRKAQEMDPEIPHTWFNLGTKSRWNSRNKARWIRRSYSSSGWPS